MNLHRLHVRVLLVDRDPVSRAASANVLAAAGVSVVGEASDPARARELAATAIPSVAVIDVDLGGMGAPTLARRLREVSRHRIEIVAQAGFTDVAALGQMVVGGTSAYVIKGKPAELIAAIQAVTSGSGLMPAEASRPVLEEIQNLYDRERERNGELEQLVTQLQALSVTDWLTGLKNHGYFFDRLSEELERSRRYARPLAVIMADLDDFKAINDAFGHSSGDAVLRTVGEIFHHQLREVDVACRVGGEEFGVILPETGVDGAHRAAERLRTAAESTTIPGVGSITISSGVAVFPDHADGRDLLVERADQALYVAKHDGKNLTVMAGDGQVEDERRLAIRTDPLTQSMLQALGGRSSAIADHSQRVAETCIVLASEMGVSDHDTQILHTAALLHDVGRLTLPDSILNNTGALTESEWRLMRRHPQAAYDMLVGSFDSDVARIVLTHHQHIDGSGYPNGIKGDDIPLLSRIVRVADAYDAMTSPRLYRGAVSIDVALRELQYEAGNELDPLVVEAISLMVGSKPSNVVSLPDRRAS